MTSASSSSEGLSLSALFSRGLESASKAYDLPSIDAGTQNLIQTAITDIRGVLLRTNAVSLFSDNETLEDIATKDLVYAFAPFVLAELISRLKTAGLDEREAHLQEAQRYLRQFTKLLESYEIIPQVERKLFASGSGLGQDAGKRRETKIAQFKKEKEIRSKINALRERKGHSPDESQNDFDLISSLITQQSSSIRGKDPLDDDDDDDEDITREMTLVLLRLIWTQGISQIGSIDNELELLRHAPREERSREGGQPSEEDRTWRLDRPVPTGGPDGKGPLMDSQGKPLRPFTILPSERARLQAEVFRPDHRLPTMTIDDYLEEERRRGNIISGGGAASQNAPTTSEVLANDAEQDGTIFGDEKQEEQRQKDEKWARFTDANPKGSGNTMNRG